MVREWPICLMEMFMRGNITVEAGMERYFLNWCCEYEIQHLRSKFKYNF